MDPQAHVIVWAASKLSGERVMEGLHAEQLGDGLWRLEATPGLALGLAAGDTFVVDEDGRAAVVERGGNLAVQVFAKDAETDALLPAVRELGGVMDGRHMGLTVFTIPARAGFPAVERVLQQFVDSHPGAEWYFGNVYDDDGVTPLCWWED